MRQETYSPAGMAFIVRRQVDPTHKSLLPEILATPAQTFAGLVCPGVQPPVRHCEDCRVQPGIAVEDDAIAPQPPCKVLW